MIEGSTVYNKLLTYSGGGHQREEQILNIASTSVCGSWPKIRVHWQMLYSICCQPIPHPQWFMYFQ